MDESSIDRLKSIVQRALDEDIGDGDVTTLCTIPPDEISAGHFIAKAAGIIAGLEVARLTFTLIDEQVRITASISDGDAVEKGGVFAAISGPTRSLLTGERTALNFMQRMSGIATMTRRYVEAIKPHHAIILDTRKTAPGLRLLDKWAVRLGGGQNHRIGLFDMVLIKNNHITAVGSITAAIKCVRECDDRHRLIEVEVRTLDELKEAIAMKPDRILLDNMNLEQMREAVQLTARRVPLEASGNVTLDNVKAIAATGVDYISTGSLTHSVRALDISLTL